MNTIKGLTVAFAISFGLLLFNPGAARADQSPRDSVGDEPCCCYNAERPDGAQGDPNACRAEDEQEGSNSRERAGQKQCEDYCRHYSDQSH